MLTSSQYGNLALMYQVHLGKKSNRIKSSAQQQLIKFICNPYDSQSSKTYMDK